MTELIFAKYTRFIGLWLLIAIATNCIVSYKTKFCNTKFVLLAQAYSLKNLRMISGQ